MNHDYFGWNRKQPTVVYCMRVLLQD